MASQKLYNKTLNNNVIINEVNIANNFISRTIGLMGRKSMKPSSSLWIKNCNRIHTCFMKFPIDVIFVDKKLIVKKIYKHAKPWHHMFLGTWGANSVFEMPNGTLENLTISIGDQLYVGN